MVRIYRRRCDGRHKIASHPADQHSRYCGLSRAPAALTVSVEIRWAWLECGFSNRVRIRIPWAPELEAEIIEFRLLCFATGVVVLLSFGFDVLIVRANNHIAPNFPRRYSITSSDTGSPRRDPAPPRRGAFSNVRRPYFFRRQNRAKQSQARYSR